MKKIKLILSISVRALLFVQLLSSLASASPVTHVSFFWEVQSWDSVLSLVTASSGTDKFEKQIHDLLKDHNIDSKISFNRLEFDGNKVRFEGLADPIIIGESPDSISYKNVLFKYDNKKSAKVNYDHLKKVWGEFKELDFPKGFFAARAMASDVQVKNISLSLLTFVGSTTFMSENDDVVKNYFGYKWFRNATEPIVLECSDGRNILTKGTDQLIIEPLVSADFHFYTTISGKKELQGQLEKITLRNKESYAITNGNSEFNNLKISEAVELNRKLSLIKKLCLSKNETERFNVASKRIQEAIVVGKIKYTSEYMPTPKGDPDSVFGVR